MLHRVLRCARGKIAKGRPIATILCEGREAIKRAGFALDYLEARHAETLAPIGQRRMARCGCWWRRLGKTRLIDNVAVPSAWAKRPCGTAPDPARP